MSSGLVPKGRRAAMAAASSIAIAPPCPKNGKNLVHFVRDLQYTSTEANLRVCSVADEGKLAVYEARHLVHVVVAPDTKARGLDLLAESIYHLAVRSVFASHLSLQGLAN